MSVLVFTSVNQLFFPRRINGFHSAIIIIRNFNVIDTSFYTFLHLPFIHFSVTFLRNIILLFKHCSFMDFLLFKIFSNLKICHSVRSNISVLHVLHFRIGKKSFPSFFIFFLKMRGFFS